MECPDCGAQLSGGEPRQPCPECGSKRRDYTRGISASIGLSANVSTIATSSNNARSRVDQLKGAIPEIEAAVGGGKVREAHEGTKRALDAIHGLYDGLKPERGPEWAQKGWTPDQIGLWNGLVGVRNATHHGDKSLVGLHGPAQGDARLRWDTAPITVDSKRQMAEYSARLAGEPVLPQLREVLALVDADVP